MFLVGISARGHFTIFPLIFFFGFSPGTIILCLIIDSHTEILANYA